MVVLICILALFFIPGSAAKYYLTHYRTTHMNNYPYTIVKFAIC